MANGPALTQDQNILPVQALFNLDNSFNTFIGQGQPFFATINPAQSGLTITNSTINSTTIGANSPSTGVFTNITATTGSVLSIPTGSNDIANKAYVDAVASGLSFKAPALVTTTGNITLSGLQTIDGVSVPIGARVLVKNQSNTAQNGIYIASSGAWSYASDANTYNDYLSAFLFVEEGTTWAGSAWVCTNQPGGTLGTTPITFTQFSNNATYTAGTGLTLTGYTFSITNIGTAGTYGSASSVPVFTTNAQGQVTSVTNTSISITNSQVSGLGTMSTQNANNVSITGGSINGTTIGGSIASAITGTTITATSSFSGSGSGLTGTASGLSIGGNAATATSAGSVTNSITFNNSGSGAASGTTYNGSVAQTISYNTVGAPSTTGSGANGTWGINVTGNAGTVTNGVYTTGSYSNPSWITSILGSIVSGAVASATTATNVAGGATGSLLYQSAASTTTSLALGTTNYVLTAGASAPQYVAQSTLSVGSATTATTATNLAGGAASQIPYQTASGTTAFIANGTTGQFLTSNGTSAPSWATPTASITISDDTSSASNYYPLYARVTSGTTSTEYTSSTKYTYNPSTGALTASSFSGSGTGLTGTASSLSIGGNAATATSATSATTSTNLAGGLAGYLPYQSAVNTTTFLAPSTNGYILTLSSGLPTWAAAPATGVTITDDTSSATAYYPLFARVTSGTATTEYTSSTNLQYTPSTGSLTALAVNSSGGALNGSIGATTPNTGTFTTITGQTEVLKGTGENLLSNSQGFSNTTYWSVSNSSVTANSTTAPDGSSTASTLVNNTSNSFHYLYQTPTGYAILISGTTYTVSIYAKPAGLNRIQFAGDGSNGFLGGNTIFNVSTGTVVSTGSGVTSASITSAGNGWYRCSITAVSTGTVCRPIVFLDNGTTNSYTGDGTSGVYLWGAMVEFGSVANTYVPTTTTAIYGTPTLSFSGVAGLGLQSDGSLYVSPAGTGALQAQATTSSTVGGNARGANAVDWQTKRTSATQVASGLGSVICGGEQNNTASGQQSFVGTGYNNNSSAYGSTIVAGVNGTNAGNSAFIGAGNAHTIGSNGAYSVVVGGNTNTGSGRYNFIGGGTLNSGTSGTIVTSQATTAVTSGSTAVTLSAPNAAIKVGQLINGTGISENNYVAAISGTSLTLSQNATATGTPTLVFLTPHGVVVGGGNNQATGSYSFIGGGGDAGTAANRNVASGDWSFVGGGRQNTASGLSAFVGGGGWIGDGTVYPNTASGAASVVAGGVGNASSGQGSFIGGGFQNISNARYTSSFGRQATTRSINGNTVFAAQDGGIASAVGLTQAGLLLLARQTTDATPTVLASDPNSAGTTNQVILPNNSAYYIKGRIIAGVTGGGNTSAWTFECAIKRGASASTTAIVSSPIYTVVAQDSGASTWAIAVSADTTNGGLAVTVTGQASTTIRWVCKVETTEMTY